MKKTIILIVAAIASCACGRFDFTEEDWELLYPEMNAHLKYLCIDEDALFDEFDDIWDDVYFPHWIFMEKRYTIDGKTTVDLDNIGSRMMEITVKVVSGTVKYDELTINTGKSYSFSLHKVKNSLVFEGNGVIELSGTREEMI